MVTPRPDFYARDAAAYLLSHLDSADGGGVTYARDASVIEGDARRSAVLGVVTARTPSTYPDWYSHAVTDWKYDGALIRAALAAVARGDTPRMSQREARWVVERIDGARADGDRDMDLPAQRGRADRQGGAMPGRAYACLSRADGAAVERVPVRAPSATLAQLREQAAARGCTLNAYLVEILTRHLASADVPGAGAVDAEPATDSQPF